MTPAETDRRPRRAAGVRVLVALAALALGAALAPHVLSAQWVGFDQVRLWDAAQWRRLGLAPPAAGLPISGVGDNAPLLVRWLGWVFAAFPGDASAMAASSAAAAAAWLIAIAAVPRPLWLLAALLNPVLLLAATAGADYGFTLLPAALAVVAIRGPQRPGWARTIAAAALAGLCVRLHFAAAPWAAGIAAAVVTARARGRASAGERTLAVLHAAAVAAPVAGWVALSGIAWSSQFVLPGGRAAPFGGWAWRFAHVAELGFAGDALFWRAWSSSWCAVAAAGAALAAIAIIAAHYRRLDPAAWGVAAGGAAGLCAFALRRDYVHVGHLVLWVWLLHLLLAGAFDGEALPPRPRRIVHGTALAAVLAQAAGWAAVPVGAWSHIPSRWMNAGGGSSEVRTVLGWNGRRRVFAVLNAWGWSGGTAAERGRGSAAADLFETDWRWFGTPASAAAANSNATAVWIEFPPPAAAASAAPALVTITSRGPLQDVSPPARRWAGSMGIRLPGQTSGDLTAPACDAARCAAVADLWMIDHAIMPAAFADWSAVTALAADWTSRCDRTARFYGTWSVILRCERTVRRGESPLPLQQPRYGVLGRVTIRMQPLPAPVEPAPRPRR